MASTAAAAATAANQVKNMKQNETVSTLRIISFSPINHSLATSPKAVRITNGCGSFVQFQLQCRIHERIFLSTQKQWTEKQILHMQQMERAPSKLNGKEIR